MDGRPNSTSKIAARPATAAARKFPSWAGSCARGERLRAVPVILIRHPHDARLASIDTQRPRQMIGIRSPASRQGMGRSYLDQFVPHDKPQAGGEVVYEFRIRSTLSWRPTSRTWRSASRGASKPTFL